ncbi:MAG: response regulator transcription factor [Bacteroidota bacterium]|jgi:two-component system alkaline phosphatase synthesis response regulator PhoP
MTKPRILLVEDEENILEMLTLNLELEGYDVFRAVEGRQALKYFKSAKYDLIILDVMLPEIDGFGICKSIRQENQHVPILMLTAKSGISEKLEGLKTGADDYMTKPFVLEEFLLRVHNLVKRSAGRRPEENRDTVYHLGNRKIDFAEYLVWDGEKKIELSKKEIQILKLFIENPHVVVSRETILEEVWGYEIYPTSRTIDNFIVNFRKLFEPNPKEPKHFHSIRGVGYRFTP